ncbi:MAG: F0F1 ATP synthase subunit A [Ktedonobacterales bacterium]
MLWNLPQIQIAPDLLYPGAPVFLTNTFILTVVSAILVAILFLVAARKPRIVPRGFQNFVEWVFEQLLALCEDVAGKVNGRRFFPWVATLFLLILFANWWEIIPSVETIGTKATDKPGCAGVMHQGILLTGQFSSCFVPWFRPPTTDLNLTIVLSILTVVLTQIYGFRILGWRLQIGRYLSLKEGPIGLIVGIMEFFLELLRVLSLSFRLFGNIFAGDVLLLVMSFISIGIGAVPFYFLEAFVGFIQAYVFAFLALLYFTLGTTAHGHDEPEEEQAAEVSHASRERVEHGLGRETNPALPAAPTAPSAH